MSFGAFEHFTLPQFIDSEMAPGAVLVFVHIPRAGGSSFAAELAKISPDHKHLRVDAADGNMPQAEKMDAEVKKFVTELEQQKYRSCSGHFRPTHLEQIKSVAPKARVVTLLRNPVDRVISHYRSGLASVRPDHEMFLQNYPTIADYVDAPENRDKMAKTLAPRPGAALAETLRNFDQLFSFAGLLEMYPMSFNIITRLLGQNSLPKLHTNATILNDEVHLAVDADMRRRIASNNELDLALYEHVRRRLVAKRDSWKAMLVERKPTSPGRTKPGPLKDVAAPLPAGRSDSLEWARLAGLIHRSHWLEQERLRIRAENRQLAKVSRELYGLPQRTVGCRTILERVRARRLAIVELLGPRLDDAFAAYVRRVNYDPKRIAVYQQAMEIEKSSGATAEEKDFALAIRDVFDPAYYLRINKVSRVDAPNPLLHFAMVGRFNAYRVNPLFDDRYYLAQAGGLDEHPLLHFVRLGVSAGLNPHPLFDCRHYARQCEAAGTGEGNPLWHYQVAGGLMRLDPSPLFDTAFYLGKHEHPDEIECALEHYILAGSESDIDPHPLFSAAWLRHSVSDFREPALAFYLGNRDVQLTCDPHPLLSVPFLVEHGLVREDASRSPLEQYLAASAVADVDPHPCFSSTFYRYQLEVERKTKLTTPPVVHYLTVGFNDKTLSPYPLFDPQVYLKANGLTKDGPELVRYLSRKDGDGLRCHELFDSRFYDTQRTHISAGASETTALEHWARDPEKRLRTDSRLIVPLDPLPLELVMRAATFADEFDAEFYRRFYSEFSGFDDAAALAHYRNHGGTEGRHGSVRSLLKNAGLRAIDVPLGFFPAEYLELHPDLDVWRDQPMRCLVHYVEHGRFENRQIGHWQLRIDNLVLDIPTASSPVLKHPPVAEGRLCVLIHVYYGDLWPELAGFIRNLQAVDSDVFVNVTESQWSPQLHHQFRKLCPEAFVQLSPNRGRDIGGHLRTLDNVDIGNYDAFAFMHTKKSRHLSVEKSSGWRQALIAAFAGNESIVVDCLKLFREQPKTGMVGSEVCRTFSMNGNQVEVDRLMARFGVEPHNRRLDYVSGTMFMIRADVVARLHRELRNTPWQDATDRDAAFFMDGQIEHAIERIIPSVTRQMGYDVVWR